MELVCKKHWGMAGRRSVVAAAMAISLMCVVASAAHANVTPTAEFTLSTNKAGQHPDLGVGLDFQYNSAAESVRNIIVDLPAGLLGNPLSVPEAQKCAVDYRAAVKNYGACPASSKIGVNSAVATVTALLIPLPIQIPTSGDVFLLKNQPNAAPEVPTRLGVHVVPHLPIGLPISVGEINLTIEVTVRNKSDYGLRNEILEDIPNQSGVPLQINSMNFTLFHDAPNGVNFLTNAIRCDAWTMRAYARAWLGNSNADTDINGTGYKAAPPDTINPDCGQLAPFNPSIAFTAGGTKAGDPASLTLATQSPTAVSLPVDQSHFRRVDVTMPDGVELNPAVTKDLGNTGCTLAQFNRAEPDTPATCPAGTAIADVTVDSPLVSLPLVGKLYIGQPGATAADRYKLFIDLRGAPNIKLEGRATVDANGRVFSTFGDPAVDPRQLPQLPYTSFKLVFKGGTRAPFTLPVTCGTHTGSVTITPWSGQPPVTRPTSISTSYDGAGAACPSTTPFDPGFSVTPGTLQAGGHSDFTFNITRPDRHQNLRGVRMSLPVGLVGAPGAAPTCSQATAAAGNCAANTAVGDITTHVGSTPDDVTLPGTLYNTVADAGEPAKLTAVVPAKVGPFDLGNVVVTLDTKLRDDYGVDVTSTDIPARFEGIAVRLRSMAVKLRANAANGPFVYAPSSCGTKTITAQFSSETTTVTRTANFNVTGCDSLAFSPSLDVVNTDTRAGKPTGINATVSMPSSPPQSTIKSAVVNLPPGFKLNPVAASGLVACTDAQRDAFTCPAASKLGDATISSPLIATPLTGGLFARPSGGAPDGSDRFPVVVVVRGVIDLVLNGRAVVNETTGDVTMRFDVLPDLAVTQFKLMTKTGSRALVTNPQTCGPHTVTSTFSPTSGGADAHPSDTLNVTACPPPGARPFAPGFGVNLSTTQSGDHPVATFSITRTAEDQELKSTTVSLPTGFVGSLAAVPLCSVADAQAGTCGASSQIGTLTAGVGSGDELLTLPGQVYLTEGQGGDIGGIAIRIPAVAGPYDLGVVAVAGRVILRPDLGLDTVFDNFPTQVKGVPTSIRDVQLTIDGRINNGNGSYMLYNATACDAKQIGATFGSYESGTATAAAPYQATGCETRTFNPTIDMTQTPNANDKTGDFPDFKISVKSPPGSATISATDATLPKTVNVNILAIGDLCEEDQFMANTCDAKSLRGTVRVTTPLLPYAVGGTARLVRGTPGAILPRLGLTIDAPINLKLLGVNRYVNVSQIFSTFSGVPDLAFSELTIDLAGGPKGLLTRVSDDTDCGDLVGRFTSHSGQTSTYTSQVSGGKCLSVASLAKCKKPVVTASSKNTRKSSGRKASFSLRYRVPSGCPAIKSFKVKLPKGTKVNKKLAKKYLTGRAGKQKLKAKNFRIKGTTITLRGLKKPTSITLTAKRGAIRVPVCTAKKRVCAKRKLNFTTTVVGVDNTAVKQAYKPSLGSKRFR
jgi:hypothetical protein